MSEILKTNNSLDYKNGIQSFANGIDQKGKTQISADFDWMVKMAQNNKVA